MHNNEQAGREFSAEDVAASFQELVTDELSEKAVRCCLKENSKTLVIAGGVGANTRLREKLKEKCEKENIDVFFPILKYCTDNAAMIGSMAYYYLKSGIGLSDLTLTGKPNVPITI